MLIMRQSDRMRYCRAAPVSRVLEQGTDKWRYCRFLGEHDQASGRVAKDLASQRCGNLNRDSTKWTACTRDACGIRGKAATDSEANNGISLLLNGNWSGVDILVNPYESSASTSATLSYAPCATLRRCCQTPDKASSISCRTLP